MRAAALVVVAACVAGAGAQAAALHDGWSDDELAVIASLRLSTLRGPSVDPSNAFEGDPRVAAFGRHIFFDPRFGRDGRFACASCHDPAKQFQDGRARGQGFGLLSRRTQPLADAGHGPWIFWDGRKDSLWSQALGPMEDPREMGGTRLGIVQTARAHYEAEYRALFGALPDVSALPRDAGPVGTESEKAAWRALDSATQQAISRAFANLGKALAAYVKTLRHAPSRFDRYAEALVRGDVAPADRLAAEEIDGLRLFIGKGRCATCHNGPLFTDHFFHSTRVPPLDAANPDPGRAAGALTVMADEFNCLGPFSDAPPDACRELRFINSIDPALRRAFRTPALRGVADRAPYMHAGQFATLEEVIGHYIRAPESTPIVPGAIHGHGMGSELFPLALSPAEVRDLVRFLGTLSGPVLEVPVR